MNRDAATLLDIFEAGRRIREFIGGMDREAFLNDEKTQSAVLHQILIMGEATKRLSPAFREEHSQVPWRLIAGMRDVTIHLYDSIDLEEVWNTATIDIPDLLTMIKPLLPRQGS